MYVQVSNGYPSTYDGVTGLAIATDNYDGNTHTTSVTWDETDGGTGTTTLVNDGTTATNTNMGTTQGNVGTSLRLHSFDTQSPMIYQYFYAEEIEDL